MIFLNSASSAAAPVFYLPFSGQSMKSSVHTEEKPRGQNPEYILIFRKNTIFNEHPVHGCFMKGGRSLRGRGLKRIVGEYSVE